MKRSETKRSQDTSISSTSPEISLLPRWHGAARGRKRGKPSFPFFFSIISRHLFSGYQKLPLLIHLPSKGKPWMPHLSEQCSWLLPPDDFMFPILKISSNLLTAKRLAPL